MGAYPQHRVIVGRGRLVSIETHRRDGDSSRFRPELEMGRRRNYLKRNRP